MGKVPLLLVKSFLHLWSIPISIDHCLERKILRERKQDKTKENTLVDVTKNLLYKIEPKRLYIYSGISGEMVGNKVTYRRYTKSTPYRIIEPKAHFHISRLLSH